MKHVENDDGTIRQAATSSSDGSDDDDDDGELTESSDSEEHSGKSLLSPPPRGTFWGRSASVETTSSDASRNSLSNHVQPSSSSYDDSVHATPDGESDEQQAQSAVAPSAESERQILLLMLLAQVCALHDPTPRTFIVHVLELYERGLLDRESIGFLFDLGLVPSASPTSTPQSPRQLLAIKGGGCGRTMPSTNGDVSYTKNEEKMVGGDDIINSSRGRELAKVQPQLSDPILLRMREASAIRRVLERHDSSVDDENKRRSDVSLSRSPSEPAVPEAKPWEVEHHPLSLSRFQREFKGATLLNSGGFGQVYHATNKMDGRDYAIKRVVFSASGYSNDSVAQVVREVRCLAKCDHPNCVRYYTSWLEPSWVTGSGTAVTNVDQVATKQTQRRLLTDIHQLVLTTGPNDQDYSSGFHHDQPTSNFEDTRQTIGSMDQSDYSDWSERYDTFQGKYNGASISNLDNTSTRWDRTTSRNPPAKKPSRESSYRYQMCFFIQMQLCKPTTLADWIRKRNRSSGCTRERYEEAKVIFCQIVRGIEHIHDKGIIHRDLKPANVFAGKDGQFKVGDFGLSKILRTANGGNDFNNGKIDKTEVGLLALDYPTRSGMCSSSGWQDPLTAGVGTASYCAPEQVASNSYCPKVDVFSLGLIFLELLCCFDTEHERIHTFQDCRSGRIPQELAEKFPDVATLVLNCTDAVPANRPSASYLLQELQQSSSSCAMEELRGQLASSERELERHREELAERDRIIEELTKQMNKQQITRVGRTRARSARNETPTEIVVETVGINMVDSATFSDEDGDY